MSSVYCQHCGAPRTTSEPNCGFCDTLFPGATASPAQPDGVPPGVLEALRRGNKIDAIKIYRDAKKTGLKESKEAVDELEKSLG